MAQRKIIQIAFKGMVHYALWDNGDVSYWDGTLRDGIWRDLVWEKDHGTEQGTKVSQKESKEVQQEKS